MPDAPMYTVTCPWCHSLSFWQDGPTVRLDGCKLQCSECRRVYIVRVRADSTYTTTTRNE